MTGSYFDPSDASRIHFCVMWIDHNGRGNYATAIADNAFAALGQAIERTHVYYDGFVGITSNPAPGCVTFRSTVDSGRYVVWELRRRLMATQYS